MRATAETVSISPATSRAQSMRCGPKSVAIPPPASRSCRHGVWPSTTSGLHSAEPTEKLSRSCRSPSTPLRAAQADARAWGRKRAFSSTNRTLPACSAASIMRRAARTVIAMGFSTATCLPARSALIAKSWWVECVVRT